MTKGPIFLDYHAHGPLDPRVARALTRAFKVFDANPHSGSLAAHAARAAVEKARASLAALLEVPARGLIFTSGATEANNLAFAGLADHLTQSRRCRIVVSAIEHASVMSSALALSDRFDVSIAPVDEKGRIRLSELGRLVTPETGLVSVAAANHEIGVVQPLEEIGRIARRAGALFHTDLAQAAGKIPLDLTNIDLASISAHKMHGPFGIGALYASRQVQRQLVPLHRGGGQEGSLRSGTTPAPLCVAFGVAARLARASCATEGPRIAGLRNRLLERLRLVGNAHLVGAASSRLPGNLNIRFDGVDAEALVMRLREDIVLSTGSACSTEALEPSPVLLALGLERRVAETAVRIGLGRFTTLEEVDVAGEQIAQAVADLRAIGQRSVA